MNIYIDTAYAIPSIQPAEVSDHVNENKTR